jgi:menaquinone-dependent protoporphyrinogen oxidase
MIVLVSYASKHGSTRGIAEAIAATLAERGIPTEVLAVDAIADVVAYDAAVLGSAIYMGRWLKEAIEFTRQHRDALIQRPVWLFSSGPLGTEVVDAEEQPRELAELREMLDPRDHQVFFGALDRDALGFGERMVVKAVKAPEGDFRDWDGIRAWAATIADELTPSAALAGEEDAP